MLLDWIAKLGFLQKDENYINSNCLSIRSSGLYMDYPLPTRKIIAQQTVGFLLTDTSDFIRNPNYIHTAMEALGQGFGLPLTDAEVIESVTTLYSRWLLNKGKRPAPIEADEEVFFRKIFRNLSLMFEPRNASVDVQVSLCSKILAILESFGREAGNRISTETWEVLLKVILGSVDVLLKDTADDANQLSTKLCPLLLRVLFQLWIRSQTMNDTLWKSLGALFVGWRHRGPVIAHWNNLCFGFTNRVIRLLYGPSEGAEVLVVAEADNSSTTYIDLKPEFVYYSWYRILHLIGEPETMTVANNYLECMKGLNLLADTFLNIKGVHAQQPDGNTILHILGPFLFEAINLYDVGALYDRGKAQAFSTLLKIFHAKSKVTQFDSRYLASLYRGIEMGLKRNNYLMSVVINNSLNLFPCEYRGIRMLVPNYLNSIESILTIKNIEGISCKVQILRNSAIKLLGTFLCLPHHYGSLKFNESATYTPDKLGTFWEIQGTLKTLLIEAIRTEDDSTNRQMLMWTVVTYLYENIQFVECKDLASSFITLLLNKIANNQWPLEDNLQALNVLSEMSNLKKFTKVRIKIMGFNGKEICAQLVLILAAFVEANMEEKKGVTLPESMIVKCLYTILDWVMGDKDQWILTNASCLKSLFKVIEVTLTGQRYIPIIKDKQASEGEVAEKKRLTMRAPSETNLKMANKDVRSPYHQPTDKIKHAAGYVLMNMLHRIDQFPTPSVGPFSVSSIPNEVEILEKYGLTPDHISVYIYDRTLLSLIRHKRVDNKMKVTVVLRDESGRYVYNAELNYNAFSFNAPTETDKLLNIPEKNLEPEVDEGLLTTLESWFTPAEKNTQEKLLKCTQTVIQRETEILKPKNYGRNANIAITRSTPPNFAEDSKDFTPSRLLLTHLGLGSLVNYENFGVVQRFNSPESKFNYLQNFSVLDKTRERETYQVGIINGFKGQTSQEMVENQEGSKLFMDFIEQIGWMVNVAEHVGYAGGLDAKVTGLYAPYYATYDFEVIFPVACLMPNKEPTTKQIHKTRLINNSKVVIVWVDELEDFKPLSESNSIVHIVIAPLPSDLYQIKVIMRHDTDHQNLPVIGPVLDSMIVSKFILPTIVRNTAINASKLLREDSTKPYVIRKFMIEDFINRYRVDVPIHSYLASQFTS